MAAPATKEQVCLKVLVNEKKNEVLFIQAGKDFVDVLLSFLTLPLGTIAKLASKESNMKKVSFGSISSLHESVANLEEKQFWTGACKEMLLRPRNPMEGYCQNMKLNIDDTEKTRYFICENWECSRRSSGGLLSTFRNQRCNCGKLMNREIFHSTSPANGKIHNEGFVSETATFIIYDDLIVEPDNFESVICLPVDLPGYHEDFNDIKLLTVNVTPKEIVDLLKCSLISETPLTDVFLQKKQFPENPQTGVLNYAIDQLEAEGGEQKIKVKLMIRKSDNKILFALGEEDFADFVLSFSTFPLGGVVHMLNGSSYILSIDNLYDSLRGFDLKYFRSPDLKDKLVKSQLAHQFKLRNQIFPIDEVPTFSFSCFSEHEYGDITKLRGYLTALKDYKSDYYGVCAPLCYLEPQSLTGEAYSKCGGRGFAKSPSLYMVTDDLVITPGSSASAISFLTKLGIPPSDLEERVISIGKKEGLSLMKASLISSSALTNGLGPFLDTMNENIPN